MIYFGLIIICPGMLFCARWEELGVALLLSLYDMSGRRSDGRKARDKFR